MTEHVPSLRRRLLRRLMIPLLALFAASGTVSYFLALYYSDDVYDGWLSDSVNSLARVVTRDAGGVRVDLPQAARSIFEWDDRDITYYHVSGARSGEIGGNLQQVIPVPATARGYRNTQLFDTRIDGHSVRVAALQLNPASGEPVLIEVAETRNKRNALAEQILLACLLPQLLLIALAGTTIWVGIRGGLQPLQDIAQQLGNQSPRAPQALAEDGVPREIRPLIHALNTLLDKWNGAALAQRKFIADAAHQLRTPLTALKLNIERGLQEPTLDAARTVLLQLKQSAERSSRLSNQLLSLARAEPGGMEDRTFAPLDLVQLARETGAEWVPRALEKNIDLSFHAADENVSLTGNALLLREAINNLLDNAIKYHPGKGLVQLSIKGGKIPRICVRDDGNGIAPHQSAQVFQRFYRGDTHGVEGSGLGLAIVQEIAALHGGDAVIEAGIDGRGVGVVLRLAGAA